MPPTPRIGYTGSKARLARGTIANYLYAVTAGDKQHPVDSYGGIHQMRIGQRRPARLLLALGLLVFLLVTQTVWAATGSSANNEIQKIRISQTDEKVRIVFDTTAFPEFTAIRSATPLQLLVDMPNTVNAGAESRLQLNDPFVAAISTVGSGPGRIRITVDLKMVGSYRVFSLRNPNRLVIDIVKKYEQKIQQDVMPGLKYTSWQRSGDSGPVWVHIAEISSQAGLALRPFCPTTWCLMWNRCLLWRNDTRR
jgi:hypothetical protein